MGLREKKKGKRGERYWNKRLDSLFPQYAPWYRNLGINGKQEDGDLLSDVANPLFVECKNYKRVLPGKIWSWWKETSHKAVMSSKPYAVLCVKMDNAPSLVFMHPDLLNTGVRMASKGVGVFCVPIS